MLSCINQKTRINILSFVLVYLKGYLRASRLMTQFVVRVWPWPESYFFFSIETSLNTLRHFCLFINVKSFRPTDWYYMPHSGSKKSPLITRKTCTEKFSTFALLFDLKSNFTRLFQGQIVFLESKQFWHDIKFSVILCSTIYY